MAGLALALLQPASAQVGDDAIVEAREALRKKDAARLSALRERVVAARHPLASWVDYWDLGSRLSDAQQADLDAFYARWSGTYVEDRLRNDWLLELGKRRDWANFRVEFPRFRMNDDREVTCYALLTQHLDGQDVRAAAVAAWHAQRDYSEGCHLLASTLVEARVVAVDDIWQEVRLSVDANRARAARSAAALISAPAAQSVAELMDNPARFLKRRPWTPSPLSRELALLAVMRLAASDPEDAAAALGATWQRTLGEERAALAWAVTARHAAIKLLPQATDYAQRAWKIQREHGHAPAWTDDTLAWMVRAALRTARVDRDRWTLVAQSIDAMSANERRDPAWDYWRARASQGRARSGPAGDADRAAGRQALQTLASGLGFHAFLAAHDLEQGPRLPPAPAPLTEAERKAAAEHPGLLRGLRMASIGLRDEGRREWNFSLRGMHDRELLAAAQMACDAADWQLCINTSERTRHEIDVHQRYPMPFADAIRQQAAAQGLDPAFVFGLIRQETRFMATLRSHAGASGLMQLMPATARWTARKAGVDYRADRINEVDLNLRLGTTYLKLVLDDFAGSQPLAAAAYNAGPGRPRRWREGPTMDAAAWAENVPFNETRDYVRKVLGNAVVYATLLGAEAPSLRQRLGPTIGPREAGSPASDRELP